ncbi:TapB family protein [Aquimarina sp. M1]
MKRLYIIITILIVSSVTAQNNCSQFYPSKVGTKITMSHYNQKNKLISETNYEVLSINSSGSESSITMNMSVSDSKKKKTITEATFTVTCDGGTTSLDPESIISPQLFDQYKNMEYSIEGKGIDIPNALSVGQQLQDGQVTMSVDAGVMSIDMTIDLKNRKVTSKETITTSAGSFNCYVITYTNTTSMSMGMKQTFYVKQWIAKGVGLVQQETTKTNGKLMSKSILTQLQ